MIFGDKTFFFATTAAIGYYAKTAELALLAFMWYDLEKTRQARLGRA